MSQAQIKIHLSQINSTVGDLTGNCQKILSEFEKAKKENCDLVVFCEMTICGYPCEDLWQKKYFISEIEEKILEIIEATKGSKCAILVGSPTISKNRKKDTINNSAILIEDGKVIKVCNKKTLANFAVFDEKRYFEAENFLSCFNFRGLNLAVLICEDMWDAKNLFLLKEQILDLVIVINSSPYTIYKQEERGKIAKNITTTLNKPLIYVNQVGGQDSLVFDGSSFVMNNEGEVIFQMKNFGEDSAVIEVKKSGEILSNYKLKINNNQISNIYKACVLGLSDYVTKNGFKKVLLGMSGGIDSALVATIAGDALDHKNISLYALPSRYNSQVSMNDALLCAENLGINLEVLSIEKVFTAMLETLPNVSDLAKENIQSRIRGNILMALSNSNNSLLLSTGNKSELACGYATLYGDMCGAFNPIKDLYKTQVYELAKWRNDLSKNQLAYLGFISQSPIPQNIITKAPTAELRPNQKDSDSLPEYEILDKILFALIEEEKSVSEVVKLGFEEEIVKKVAKLFYVSEYKRKQSPIGPKISKMAFDKDRRYQITNKFCK
jgi:NAD+ synthetase